MSGRFLEQAITKAGLASIIPARRRGDLEAVRALIDAIQGKEGKPIDLLVIGAVADSVRSLECGEVVFVHPSKPTNSSVTWIETTASTNELDLLRAVAIARITGPLAARVGVDWGRYGLELAQVALGFGGTDLTGPITRKNGVVIRETETKKVKGLGMVASDALKLREIEALVRNAGRQCEIVPLHGDPPAATTNKREHEAAHV